MSALDRPEAQGNSETPYSESKVSIDDYSMNRRKFLKLMGMGVGMMGVGTGSLMWGVVNENIADLKRREYARLYAERTVLIGDEKVKREISDEINEELEIPSNAWAAIHKTASLTGFGTTLFAGWFLNLVKGSKKPHKNKRAVKVEDEAPELVLDNSRFLLPPIGGKVISSKGDDLWYVLPPTIKAEEQVAIINGLQAKVDLGPFYVHQLSAQGRLRDPFKYAALALILDNPYPNDWTTPLYNADWGKVAPLVHDGGNTTYLNINWRVQGRTDFLQRVSITSSRENLDLLKLGPVERSELSKKDLFKALFLRQEQERLLIESKFYQRIALARHCREGSSIYYLDLGSKALLAWEWDKFEQYMKGLTYQLGIWKFDHTSWFLDTPRDIWEDFPKRFEADWPPIQQLLIKLEAERQERSGLVMQMRNYIVGVTNRIDGILGIKI